MNVKTNKKLIEVALPLEAINIASAREKSIRKERRSRTVGIWYVMNASKSKTTNKPKHQAHVRLRMAAILSPLQRRFGKQGIKERTR